MTIHALKESLQQEKAAWQQLLELLEQERAALGQVGLGDLQAITTQKNVQVQCLTQLDTQRTHACKAAQAPLVPEALLAWLHQAPVADAKPAAAAWQECLQLARRAMVLNQENGSLLNAKYLNNQQALNVLFGLAKQDATYDRSGAMSVGDARRLVSLG